MVCQSKIARSQAGRSSAARVSSAAPKKKSFDRGGPVWPPRSNVTNDRLGVGVWGGFAPQPKIVGSGGQLPPAKKNDVTVTYQNRRLTKPYVPDIVNEDWM